MPHLVDILIGVLVPAALILAFYLVVSYRSAASDYRNLAHTYKDLLVKRERYVEIHEIEAARLRQILSETAEALKHYAHPSDTQAWTLYASAQMWIDESGTFEKARQMMDADNRDRRADRAILN